MPPTCRTRNVPLSRSHLNQLDHLPSPQGVVEMGAQRRGANCMTEPSRRHNHPRGSILRVPHGPLRSSARERRQRVPTECANRAPLKLARSGACEATRRRPRGEPCHNYQYTGILRQSERVPAGRPPGMPARNANRGSGILGEKRQRRASIGHSAQGCQPRPLDLAFLGARDRGRLLPKRLA